MDLEPAPPRATGLADASPLRAALLPQPVPSASDRYASPRTIRWIELGLLLAVAFGSVIYHSLVTLPGVPVPSRAGSFDWPLGIVHELTGLGLCAYLLHKQGRSFRDIGFNVRWFDPFFALGIFVLQLGTTWGVSHTLVGMGLYSPADQNAHLGVVSHVIGINMAVGMVIFQIINGFYEELIVRAYLMTDLASLTGSTLLATVVSSVLQGTYHLYQGWQAAVIITVMFWVFSMIYATTRRIFPIILAHVLWDLMVYFTYLYWLKSHHS